MKDAFYWLRNTEIIQKSQFQSIKFLCKLKLPQVCLSGPWGGICIKVAQIETGKREKQQSRRGGKGACSSWFGVSTLFTNAKGAFSFFLSQAVNVR